MAVPPRSTLLDWLDYAFQAAGAPPPVDAAYGHQRHSTTVVTDVENTPPKSCESDGIISTGSGGLYRRLFTGAVCRPAA